MLDPLLFSVFVIIASVLILFKSADYVVYGISRYARKLGLSDLLAGLVVVSLAASMPEVIASLTGIMVGKEEVLFGTMLGTNMVHLALVFGVLSIVGKKIKLECELLDKKLWLLWLVLLVPFVLMADGNLSRIDGIILLVFYALYLGVLWVRESSSSHLKHRVLMKTIWRDALIFMLSLVALLLAGRWLVFGAVNAASILGVSAYFISLTVIAFAGALPDFAVGLRSILKGHQAIGVGDVLGSVVLEFLLFFGLVGLLHPLTFSFAEIANAVIFLVIALTYVLFLVKKKSMTWKNGVVLIALYVMFLIVEITKLVR